LRELLIKVEFLEQLWELDNIVSRTEKLENEMEDFIEKKHI
jgi:hypothetical protein